VRASVPPRAPAPPAPELRPKSPPSPRISLGERPLPAFSESFRYPAARKWRSEGHLDGRIGSSAGPREAPPCAREAPWLRRRIGDAPAWIDPGRHPPRPEAAAQAHCTRLSRQGHQESRKRRPSRLQGRRYGGPSVPRGRWPGRAGWWSLVVPTAAAPLPRFRLKRRLGRAGGPGRTAVPPRFPWPAEPAVCRRPQPRGRGASSLGR